MVSGKHRHGGGRVSWPRDRRDRPRGARGRRRHARQRGQARGRGGVAPAGPRDDAAAPAGPRGLATSGLFGALSVYALLLAELGELGLQALASRALVAGTLSLESARPGASRPRRGRGGASAASVAAGAAVAGRLAGPARSTGRSSPCSWRGSRSRAGVSSSASPALPAARGGSRPCSSSSCAAAALGRRGGALGAGTRPPGRRGGARPLARFPRWRSARPSAPHGAGRPAARRVPPARRPAASPLPLAAHGGLLLLSPRVEFLVLSWLGDRARRGSSTPRCSVFWFLVDGAERGRGGSDARPHARGAPGRETVRRRTAATLAPSWPLRSAVGLALVARARSPSSWAGAPRPPTTPRSPACCVLLSAAVPALFLNALLFAALIASGPRVLAAAPHRGAGGGRVRPGPRPRPGPRRQRAPRSASSSRSGSFSARGGSPAAGRRSASRSLRPAGLGPRSPACRWRSP